MNNHRSLLTISVFSLMILFACDRNNSRETFVGKWAVNDPSSGYNELWFSDSLAMAVEPQTGLVSTFIYRIDNEHLKLQPVGLSPDQEILDLNIRHQTDSLVSLSSGEKEITYTRISSFQPEITVDPEVNRLSIQSRLRLMDPGADDIINRVGFTCGDTTELTFPVRLMMEKIEDHDINGIRMSLYSSDSSDQFLSYIVVKNLQRMGKLKISDKDSKRMTTLRHSGQLVHVCFSRSYWQAVPLKELLGGHVVGMQADRWFKSVLEMNL